MTGNHFTRITRAAMVLSLAAGLSACSGGLFGGGDKKATPTVGERMPVLSRIESGAVVDPALAGVAVVLPPATVNTDWSQGGGNAAKSNGHVALAENPEQAWTVSIAGSTNRRRLASAPVIGGGIMVAVGTDGVVSAFDAATGARRWTYQMKVEDNLQSAVFGGGATYDGGRVYATNGVGEVAALDAQTGAEIWRVKPAGPLRGSPTVAFNTVFVMTQDNQIISLSAADGSNQWQESGFQRAGRRLWRRIARRRPGHRYRGIQMRAPALYIPRISSRQSTGRTRCSLIVFAMSAGSCGCASPVVLEKTGKLGDTIAD